MQDIFTNIFLDWLEMLLAHFASAKYITRLLVVQCPSYRTWIFCYGRRRASPKRVGQLNQFSSQLPLKDHFEY